MGRLADKNILITGGNSGIGLATAQEFDREGARVAICGLNEGTLQATKKTLASSVAVPGSGVDSDGLRSQLSPAPPRATPRSRLP
jgi:NAD(P)-dependent dehydrogenase (short-subunit alcohol dehydrogenase family)